MFAFIIFIKFNLHTRTFVVSFVDNIDIIGCKPYIL